MFRLSFIFVREAAICFRNCKCNLTAKHEPANPAHPAAPRVDDRAVLKAIWLSMRLPADELEKRLTEFQVVENTEGRSDRGAWFPDSPPARTAS